MTNVARVSLLSLFLSASAIVSFTQQSGVLLVANQVEHTLVIVDPDTGKQLGSVVVGINDHEVAASPDGKLAYVPIYSNVGLGVAGTNGSTIDVVDIAHKNLAYSIDLGKPVRPHRAQFGNDGLLYVSAELANAIYVVDPVSRKVAGSIPTGEPQSHMFAMHGDRAYTANVSTGTVSVIDLKNRKVITTIPVAKEIQRISLSPDGKLAFTHAADNRVIVIDTATNTVKATIPTPGYPYSSAVTPDGKFLIVMLPKDSKAVVVDLATMKIAHEIPLPAAPVEVLTDVLGGVAYVSCFVAGQVAVIDLKSWTVSRTIQLTKGVDGLGWASARTNKHD